MSESKDSGCMHDDYCEVTTSSVSDCRTISNPVNIPSLIKAQKVDNNFPALIRPNRRNSTTSQQHPYSIPSSTIPAPRLVGIELNPGPSKSKMKKSKNSIVGVNTTKRTYTSPYNNLDNKSLMSTQTKVAPFTTLTQTEFIGDITATQNVVSASSVNVNPGNTSSFSWMGPIAQNFTKYRFESLEFIYKPSVSSFAAQAYAGKVLLTWNYDVTDPPPTTYLAASDSIYKNECQPFQAMSLPVNCQDFLRQDSWYIRGTYVPGGQDPKTYDCGKLAILLSGFSGGSGVIGSIYVRYKVRLWDPIASSINTNASNFKIMQRNFYRNIASTGTNYEVLNSTYWSTGITNSNLDPNPPFLIGGSTASDTWYLAPGFYHVSLNYTYHNDSALMTKAGMVLFLNGIDSPYGATGTETGSATGGVYGMTDSSGGNTFVAYPNGNTSSNSTGLEFKTVCTFSGGTTTLYCTITIVAIA